MYSDEEGEFIFGNFSDQFEKRFRDSDSISLPVFTVTDQVMKLFFQLIKEEGKTKGSQVNFYGNVGSVIQGNEGEIQVQADQRSVQGHLENLENLMKLGNQEGFITKEEYEELLDILDEIKETPEPTARKKSKWKRWLGKAAKAGGNFIKGRVEKGTDTVLSEELKDWVEKGGLGGISEIIDKI